MSSPTRAPNTNKRQDSIHISIAVKPSALGVLVVTVLKMLTSTRKRVIRSAMRPGITSGGTTKLIQDTTTNRPYVGRTLEIEVTQKYRR